MMYPRFEIRRVLAWSELSEHLRFRKINEDLSEEMFRRDATG
jgi:hypothetical protein